MVFGYQAGDPSPPCAPNPECIHLGLRAGGSTSTAPARCHHSQGAVVPAAAARPEAGVLKGSIEHHAAALGRRRRGRPGQLLPLAPEPQRGLRAGGRLARPLAPPQRRPFLRGRAGAE